MKYMLLSYSVEEDWDDEQRKACVIQSVEICRQLSDQEKLVNAAPLQPVTKATSLRERHDDTLLTNGPFAETEEQLVGCYVIDVKDLDEAVSIAKLFPTAKLGTVEIRPVFDASAFAEAVSGVVVKAGGESLVATESPFEMSIQCQTSTGDVFECLTSGLSRWWSDRIEGDTRAIGDIFKVRFEDSHKTFCVEDLAPGERVIWKCIDSHLALAELKNPSEWNGTNLRWEIERRDDRTSLKLSHEGLSPKLECFEACKAGWAQYINGSLLALLNGKPGKPFVNKT